MPEKLRTITSNLSDKNRGNKTVLYFVCPALFVSGRKIIRFYSLYDLKKKKMQVPTFQ
jgi:hypothetical protein